MNSVILDDYQAGHQPDQHRSSAPMRPGARARQGIVAMVIKDAGVINADPPALITSN